MSVTDLLLRLRELGVTVRLEGDRLTLGTVESLPDDLQAAVRDQEPALVAFLRDVQAASGAQAAPAIPTAPRTGPLPLSFAQQRFWFVSQLEADNAAFNTILALRLRGNLDVAALEWCLGEIVRRHEALRTTVTVTDGQPGQVVAAAGQISLDTRDLSAEADAETAAKRVLQEESERPFDLVTGPVFRASLLRLGDDDHVLLAAMHHIVSDRASWGVFCDELGQLYAARSAGRPSPLPDLRIQYADYAVWQRAEYDRRSAALLAFWKDRLAGAPTLALPTDRARPARQTFGGANSSVVLPTATVDALGALARQEGCTLFMALLAAVDVLLARYSGQEDIVVGIPVANRSDVDLEPLIGAFFNSLVLRTDLSGDPSFLALLRRVREVSLQADAHQDMPFEQLVFELKPERDLSRNPVFQVMFNLLDDAPPPALGELRVEHMAPDAVASAIDLMIAVERTAGATVAMFEYNVDLFDAGTILRMQEHFVGLLEAVVAAPDRRIWDHDVLLTAERQRLLVDVNDTARDYPRDRAFTALFAEHAAATPDAVAVVADDATLTYRELDERSTRIAAVLRDRGAGAGTLVGLCVERSAAMLAALLGILRSGAAYVPLDPTYPRERVAMILEDSGCALLVTEAAQRRTLPDELPPLLLLDEEAATIDAAPAAAGPEPAPDDLAYVIFTSGSTGRPKGVEIQHRALQNFLCSMRHEPGMTADDAMVAVTTISFDIAALELYLPLIAGGRVVIASDRTTGDGRRLQKLMAAQGATIMQATPATWHLLVEAGWQGDPGLTVLCGGEAFPRSLADALAARSRSVWNMYGPTETTIWSLVGPVEAGEGPVTLGPPIANTAVYLLDPHGQPCPTGVPGRVHLGGDGLARGYLGRPEMTAEKFTANPLGDDGGFPRLYDTGDLAVWRADGRLEFLGRVDAQVKVRGFRIELGEIEHALSRNPAIRECVVLVRDHGGADKRLVAYVLLKPGAPATVTELRKHLRTVLPDYMIPSSFVTLDEFPRTPNGKIDRKALPDSAGERMASGSPHVPPATATEKEMARIWGEVLGVQRVGLQDNFFDLGGHSLLAMQVVFRMEKELGMRHGPMDLLIQSLGQLATRNGAG